MSRPETSDETRDKISQAMIKARANKPNWTDKPKYQPPHTELAKERISEARKDYELKKRNK